MQYNSGLRGGFESLLETCSGLGICSNKILVDVFASDETDSKKNKDKLLSCAKYTLFGIVSFGFFLACKTASRFLFRGRDLGFDARGTKGTACVL